MTGISSFLFLNKSAQKCKFHSISFFCFDFIQWQQNAYILLWIKMVFTRCYPILVWEFANVNCERCLNQNIVVSDLLLKFRSAVSIAFNESFHFDCCKQLNLEHSIRSKIYQTFFSCTKNIPKSGKIKWTKTNFERRKYIFLKSIIEF